MFDSDLSSFKYLFDCHLVPYKIEENDNEINLNIGAGDITIFRFSKDGQYIGLMAIKDLPYSSKELFEIASILKEKGL